MGGSTYSSSVFTAAYSSATSGGKDPGAFFSHTAAISSGAAPAKVHEKLDPAHKNKAGKIVRESLDSDVHPNSTPIAVLFDVTGSMGRVPREFVTKLVNLMNLLTKKNYLANPHILFGAIGDAYVDKVPLQVGQFEGGNEMDDVLSLIYIEGGGGGQDTESYELAMYFMARHTELDSVNKRGKKGYLFLLGDERPYPVVSRSQVERLIGVSLESDISTKDILEELREKFEVFWIMPGGTSHWNDEDVNEPLRKMFEQNFLKMENPEEVCELIATTIGVCEGFDVKSIEADLVDLGSSKSAVRSASTAIAPFVASSSALARKVATVDGSLSSVGADTVERL